MRSTTRIRRRAAVSAAAVLAVVLAPPSSAAPREKAAPAAGGGGVRFVAPNGDDRNPGTKQRPWRTLGKAVDALGPGQTAYLRAGEYAEATSGSCSHGTNAVSWSRSGTQRKPITIAGAPGEERRVIVKTLVNMHGAWLTLRNLVLDRNTAFSSFDDNCSGSVNVAIYGANDALVEVEVRNAAMSGVYVNDAVGAVIARSAIHDNGTHRNLDHGIYVSSSQDLVVASNVIVGNLAFGIQFYKDPSVGGRVVNNTVVANGRSGLVLSGAVRGIRVVNNIFADNAEFGIREHHLDGSDNIGLANLYFRNRQGSLYLPDGRFSSKRGLAADPMFVRPKGRDFHLGARSPARKRGDAAYATVLDFDRVRRPKVAPAIGAFER